MSRVASRRRPPTLSEQKSPGIPPKEFSIHSKPALYLQLVKLSSSVRAVLSDLDTAALEKKGWLRDLSSQTKQIFSNS